MKWINRLISRYLQRRRRDIEYFRHHPREVQERLRNYLLNRAQYTVIGQYYHFNEIHTAYDYAQRLPISDYDGIKPYIKQMMFGQADVLWPGQIKWYAKSSGTTSDKSKFIPVSPENLKHCHYKSSWDSVALLYERRPDIEVFSEKNLVMGGSLQRFEPFPETRYGDVSALMVHHMPMVGRPFYTPDFETALLADWNEKVERMARQCSEENVTMFGGVPTWTIVLFRRILELTGKSNMLEVWPEVKAYLHGGVGFDPYRAQFKEFIPTEDFVYQEIYNASEGFFACQDRTDHDMLLFLDHGIYFEFLPESEWESDQPRAIPLWEVELDRQYSLVISTNSGLWRYTPGDTVRFTSIRPYRIQITGRMQQFINAFGEEVVVANTDRAISIACEQLNTVVRDYTVAPIYFAGDERGGHEWVIEFEQAPADLQEFSRILDLALQSLNSDYEAKRYQNLALENLKVVDAPKGTFDRWLKSKGKLGGQHKIPRLSNHRKVVDEILEVMNQTAI